MIYREKNTTCQKQKKGSQEATAAEVGEVVALQEPKWPIVPEFIPVSVAWNGQVTIACYPLDRTLVYRKVLSARSQMS